MIQASSDMAMIKLYIDFCCCCLCCLGALLFAALARCFRRNGLKLRSVVTLPLWRWISSTIWRNLGKVIDGLPELPPGQVPIKGFRGYFFLRNAVVFGLRLRGVWATQGIWAATACNMFDFSRF